MKIGLDASDLFTGRADGTTRYTLELVRRLPAKARDLVWDFYTPGQPTKVTHLPTNARWRISPWPKYWTQLRLPWELYRFKPDVLFMPIQQLPILRPRRMKTVAVVHDLAWHFFGQESPYKDWVLLHAFTAQAVREADQIIAVSQATADDIARVYGRTTHVRVVRHGVDHKQFRPPRDTERDTAWRMIEVTYPALRKPYLLYIGQIQPRKNLIRLIQAFEILAEHDADLQLFIGGSHGWLQQSIIDRVAASTRRDRIFMPGRVPEELLPPLYWHAETFVLPSLYEGFGMPLLEAMATGCPVVTSNVSAMPEIVGQAGILIDPQSPASIAAGIKHSRSTKDEWRKRGYTQAALYTWDATVSQTLEVVLS